MNSQIKEKPKPLRGFNQEIPSKLEKIVLQALEKDPAKRFSSALEFSQALRKLALNEPATPKSAREGAFMAFFKNYPAVVIAIMLLVPAGSYALWRMSASEPDETIPAPAIAASPPQFVETIMPDIQPETQPPSAKNETLAAIDPQLAPPTETIPQLTLPENEYISAPPDDGPMLNIDELDSATPRTGATPIPGKKPESVKRKTPIRSAQQSSSQKVTPQQQETSHKAQPPANSPASEENANIGNWAKDFFDGN